MVHIMVLSLHVLKVSYIVANSVEVVENTDCTSQNECSVYVTKQYDGEAPVILELWGIWVPLHCHRSKVYSDPEWLHLIGS